MPVIRRHGHRGKIKWFKIQSRSIKVLSMYSNDRNVSVPVDIDENRIDADAAFVIRRLRRSGFEADLVGGSVRDLLLHRQPKDFDVATSASPEEIKQIFRRCRLIGRRFRLAISWGRRAHVETATFRSKPSDHSQDEIIWDDNEFGTVESDAHRQILQLMDCSLYRE